MAERNRPHLFIDRQAEVERYQPPPRDMGSPPDFGPNDRRAHGRHLQDQLTSVDRTARERRAASEFNVEGAAPGIYVSFESFAGLDLAIESLDPRQGAVHPELLAVRAVIDADGERAEQATVFIPDGELGYFLRRIEQYLQTTEADTVRNRNLVDRIRSIGVASLKQLWTDSARGMPAEDESAWWEVWLRRRDGREVERLRAFAAQAGIVVRDRALAFPDRVVVLVWASSANSLGHWMSWTIWRSYGRHVSFHRSLAAETARDQSQRVEGLRNRIEPPADDAPAVCLLDTGVSHSHPLLSASLELSDCHQCDPNWATGDHRGHGTEMAGIALFGDVGEAFTSGGTVTLRHRLESVMILPPAGENPPELYGAITAIATSLAEIEAPDRRRIFSMAVTAGPDTVGGSATDNNAAPSRPTSWSAAVDALAAGVSVDSQAGHTVLLDEGGLSERRLFIISAGNVSLDHMGPEHLDRSDLEPVEDPAQAWNALTVGAYTDLDRLDPDDHRWDGWAPVARAGELSPFSRTSVAFGRGWPHKPDVVAEGGNVATSPAGMEFDTPDALQILTTRRVLPDGRLLTTSSGTSAATAEVAHIATSVLAEYPGLSPEAVRALVMHSADWTEPMKAKFGVAGPRQDRVALRRRYGMGVPDLTRATRSASDALTLIVQDTIHPFDGDGRMLEMHLHELPWPTQALHDLGSVEVRLRVTLSYFIEPNPSRRGWRGRYRYASHGLRFDLRRPTESTVEFRRRINQLAREDGTKHKSADTDAPAWLFGPDNRAAGSVHADVWGGTASELALRGCIAVFPVSGWWKDRKDRDRSDRGVHYSLVVSIESPTEDVDLWTPVATELGVPIEVEY